MAITEIKARSLIRRQKRPDSWFVASIGMNLYRGCRHDCVYCDGRSERYYVEGEFGRDVAVKVNAPELLRREIDPARRRKPLPGGYLLLGGGVGDSYQPAEERYRLSRQALEILAEFRYPVEVLTKSTLVLRDLEVLQRIHRQRRALVCFSLSSVDELLSRVFEPGVPSPRARLEAMAAFRAAGIPCGLFLMPIIPGVTDSARLIEQTMHEARDAGAQFVVFGGMTLKDGRQKEHFLAVLRGFRPNLADRYPGLYPGDPWGQAKPSYYAELNRRCGVLARRAGLPPRMPSPLWADLLSGGEKVGVMLEQLDYLLRLAAPAAPLTEYGRAARIWAAEAAAAASAGPPPGGDCQPPELPRGIGSQAGEVIREILRTGTSGLYERLIGGKH